MPLVYITPLFTKLLIEASYKKPVVLIFEKYNKTYSTGQIVSPIDDWICQCLLSTSSAILTRKNNKFTTHRVRIIISGRNPLPQPNNAWESLIQSKPDCFKKAYLNTFKESESKAYLRLLDQKKFDTLGASELKKYLQTGKGHSRYLELLFENRQHLSESVEANKNKYMAQLFLDGFSEDQKQILQIIACCRWLDRQLIQEVIIPIIKQKNLPSRILQQNPQGTSFEIPIFEWIIRQHFITFQDNRYCLHGLVRDVLRQVLFQEERELFYKVNSQLAYYFKERADNLQQGKPQFTKYDDAEWCGYIGEMLYHACFAQDPHYQPWFIYHLFASIYRRQKLIIKTAFHAIQAEYDLAYHPLLQRPTQLFLQRLEFVIKYDWVAFELNHGTYYGKYGARIEAAVQLIKNQIGELPEGIGKVAALEFIVKNFPLNTKEKDKNEWKKQLRQAIERTAHKSDPDFSSRLFMQSVCWQAGHDEGALGWCDQALDYKSDDANAWYKRGQILQEQADDLKDHRNIRAATEQYKQAVESYNKALEIQSYDHRYLQAKGQALSELGNMLADQTADAAVSSSCSYNDESCQTLRSSEILMKAAYFRQAHECYTSALSYRPDDGSLKQKKKQAEEDCQAAIDAYTSMNKRESVDASQEDSSCTELIKKGDDVRCNEKNFKDKDPEQCTEEINDAIELYNQAIWKKPDYPLAWYSRGLAYAKRAQYQSDLKAQQREYRKAIEDYEKALSLKTDLAWAYYDMGLAYHSIAEAQEEQQLGPYEAQPELQLALEKLDQAIRIDPDYEDAWYGRGLTLIKLGRYEEATASYDKAIEYAERRTRQRGSRNGKRQPNDDGKLDRPVPRIAWYWFNRGNAYRENGDIEEAIASYQAAIQVGKDIYPDPYISLGNLLRDRVRNYGEAEKHLKTAEEILEDQLNKLSQDSYQTRYRKKELVCVYRSLAQADIQRTNGSHFRTYLRQAQDQLSDLRNFLPSSPGSSAAEDKFQQGLATEYFRLGEIYRQHAKLFSKGNQKARDYYQQALNIAPCLSEAFAAYYRLTMQQGADSDSSSKQPYKEAVKLIQETISAVQSYIERGFQVDSQYEYDLRKALLNCYAKIQSKDSQAYEKAKRIHAELNQNYAQLLKFDLEYSEVVSKLAQWEDRIFEDKSWITWQEEKYFAEAAQLM